MRYFAARNDERERRKKKKGYPLMFRKILSPFLCTQPYYFTCFIIFVLFPLFERALFGANNLRPVAPFTRLRPSINNSSSYFCTSSNVIL